jgi:hypothetical protein
MKNMTQTYFSLLQSFCFQLDPLDNAGSSITVDILKLCLSSLQDPHLMPRHELSLVSELLGMLQRSVEDLQM